MRPGSKVLSALILIVSVLFGGIYFYLPSFVHGKVADLLAQQEADLACLEWQLNALNRLHIQNLCVEYQGATFVLRDAILNLSLAELWRKQAGLSLLNKVQIEQLDIKAPMTLLEEAQKNQADAETSKSNVLPFVLLPDISIAQLRLRLTSPKDSPLITLDDDPLLNWRVQLDADAAINQLKFSSLQDKQQSLTLTQTRKGALGLKWQLKLGDLYRTLNTLLPRDIATQLTPIKALSGRWQGQLNAASEQLTQWQSSHQFSALKAQIRLPELIPSALSVRSNLSFNLEQKQGLLRASEISQEPVVVSGITPLLAPYISRSKLQQWRLENPLSEEIQILLPDNLTLTQNGLLNIPGKLQLQSAEQKLHLTDIAMDIQQQTLLAKVNLESQLQLNRHTDGLPENYLPLSLAGFGQLEFTPEQQRIVLQNWNAKSPVLFKLLPTGVAADFKDVELYGESTLSRHQQDWAVEGDIKGGLHDFHFQLNSDYAIKTERIELSGSYKFSEQAFDAQAVLKIQDKVKLDVTASGNLDTVDLVLKMPKTEVKPLTLLLQGLPEKLKLTGGTLIANGKTRIKAGKPGVVDLNLAISELSASWDSYLMSGVTTQLNAVIDSDGAITSKPGTLKVAQFFSGVAINDITMDYALLSSAQKGKQSGVKPIVKAISANVLGGTVRSNDAFYPLNADNQIQLDVERLAVPELVALFNQQGLEVTGALSGTIPVLFSDGSVSVRQAKLTSVEPGIIRIRDNPAFINLKNSQKNLAVALGLLENLEYSQLQTEVSLAADGWLEMAVKMNGLNPEKQQPINFNPTFSTNLYTGLKALRAGKDISKAIEQKF